MSIPMDTSWVLGKTEESIYPLLRNLVGAVVGLPPYRARCQVMPNACFRSVEVDIGDDDLLELTLRLERIFGLQGSFPVPGLSDRVGEWIACVHECLHRHQISDARARDLLVQHFERERP